MTSEIHVTYMGNFGNKLIQTMVAQSIAMRCRSDVSIFFSAELRSLKKQLAKQEKSVDFIDTVSAKGWQRIINTDELKEFCNLPRCKLTMQGYYQRIDYIEEDRDFYRLNLLVEQCEKGDHTTLLDYAKCLLIHIRAGDTMSGLGGGWYFPLHLSYYEKIIDESGLSPVFIGQFDSFYGDLLKRKFKTALFVDADNPNIIFDILRNAHHMALSLSTFSWCAAFLSKRIQTIHFPLAGLFQHKNSNPDQPFFLGKLAPKTLFYDFGPVFLTMGEFEDISSVITNPIDPPLLSEEQFEQLRHQFKPQTITGIAGRGPKLPEVSGLQE